MQKGSPRLWRWESVSTTRTLRRPGLWRSPGLFLYLQPRLILGRESPGSTEVPAQCRPRRWDPRSLQELPLLSRGGSAQGGARPLSGDPRSIVAPRRVPTLCPLSAPRPPSQFPQLSGPRVSPSPDPRARMRAHPTGLRCPAPPTVHREAAAPGAQEARGAQGRARCRERSRFLPTAPAPAPGAGFCSKRAGRSSATRALRRKSHRLL